MSEQAQAGTSSSRHLAHLQIKLRELLWETQFFARFGQTWRERLSIAKLAAILYAARLMPFDTYRWEATVLSRGARYVIGVRTSEIFVFHEIYGALQYDRHPDFVVQSGWTVFDVGANIGVFTVLLAKQGAKVFSFEPNPDSCSRLSRNVATNNLSDRVRVFPTALGDKHGTGKLCVINGGTTGGMIAPLNGNSASGVEVPIATLDEVASSLSPSTIDLMKIDAEGSEVAILRGGEQTLDRVQRIIVEYHSRELLRQVREILTRKGFSEEVIVDYYAEDLSTGQDEVGILYARRLPSRPQIGDSTSKEAPSPQ